MAENKRFTLDWDTTGLTVYGIIRRESDDFRMDDSDGSFVGSPVDPYVSLTEDAVIKGRYELDESRTIWVEGRYTLAIYNQAGGSPVPASDTIIGTGEMSIKDDLETVLDFSISKTPDLIWDEILTSDTHNINKSAGKRMRGIEEYQGYEGGKIYIDTTGGGSSGSESYVNGVLDNAVDNLADALIIATNLGINCFEVASGSALTFVSSQDGRCFEGHSWTLALGGQSINGLFVEGADISGIATASTTSPSFHDCSINGTTLPPGHYHYCGITGDMIAGTIGDYFFVDCSSAIAGTGTPSFDYGAAIGDTNFNFRSYHGGMELENMGQTGTDNCSFDGDGQITINANSIGGTIRIAGHQKLTGAEAFILAGGVIEDSARFATDQLDPLLDQITGTGNRTITIHVQDTDTNDLQDVLVRIGEASQTTDVSGDAVFALDDGDYDVILRKNFVSFTVPEALTVAGDGTHNFTGTLIMPSAPTQPDTCVVFGYVIDDGGNPIEGAEILINETDNSTFANTQKVVLDKSTTSNINGFWELEVMRSSELAPATSPYEAIITYGDTGFRFVTSITVPDADSVEFSTIVNT